MAKEIGVKLNFTSTGEQKVIKNLNDLESELGRLQAELKTLDFGSAAFKEAAINIQTLKSRIDEVDKATEGIGAEKRFRALGDAINVATGSFQVLSGVLGLVITREEDLEAVQKAEAAALQVLNIALGINAINTALVESASLRTTIALKAQTIATTITTTATNLFNAALKANPIGLVVAGVIALTAAIYGLVKAFQAFNKPVDTANEILKQQNEIENSLIQTKRKAGVELERQLTILTDNVDTRNLELKVINELRKAYPGFNAFIDKNNKLTKDGVDFLKETINLRRAEAAAVQISTSLVDEEIKLQQEINRIRAEEGFTTRAANQIAKAREESRIRTQALLNLETKYNAEIDKSLGILDGLNKKLNAQAKAEELASKNAEKNSDAISKSTQSIINRTTAIDFYIKKIQELTSVELKYTADVLAQQQEILQNQEALINQRTSALATASQKLQEELGDLLKRVIPDEKGLKAVNDRYKLLFDTLGTLYEQNGDLVKKNLGFDELLKEASKVEPELADAFDFLSEDSKKAITEYFNSIRERVVILKGELKKVDFIDPPSFTKDDEELVRKISELEDKIYTNRKRGILDGFTEADIRRDNLKLIDEAFGYSKKLFEIEANISEEKKKGDKADQTRIKSLEEQQTKIVEFNNALLENLTKYGDFYAGIEEVQKQVDTNNQKILKNLDDITRKLTPEEFEGLVNFFKSNIEQFDTLTLDILNNFDDYINKVGEDGIVELFQVLGSEVSKLDNVSREQLDLLIQQVEVAILIGKALGNNTTELEKYLLQLQGVFKKLPTEAEDNLDKAFDKINEFAQDFVNELSKVSSRFQDILQSQSSLLLENLARDEENALKAVEGTSKRLIEEQEKIRKEYAKTRFEIEKEARITELKFSLAQVITDSALAITNTLANVPFPASIPLAATIGGLATAQALQVRNQLTFAQSQQFVGRRGGLISGESHEGSNGGVPALLEGGEFVMNRAAVSQYGDLIGELNSATGGRKLAIDDSRLVQTIAKQNQNTPPLKAFVLYQDIQNTDKLNRRITQLARL